MHTEGMLRTLSNLDRFDLFNLVGLLLSTLKIKIKIKIKINLVCLLLSTLYFF